MAVNTTFPTPLGTRKGVTFFDPLNPTTSIYTSKLNPVTLDVMPNVLRAFANTNNGTSVILGDREGPPKGLKMVWNQIDQSDFNGIRQFTGFGPIVFVDNNDNGYLGYLNVVNQGQLPNKSGFVYHMECEFLVLAPYNGLVTPINVLPAPTLSYTMTTGGYIPASNTFYLFSTVFTPWGESIPSTALTVTSTGSNQAALITFTAPTSSYYRKTRLYWNSTNNATTATMLADITAGLSATFTIFSNYIAYSTLNPPTYTSAFTGIFEGGHWTNDN